MKSYPDDHCFTSKKTPTRSRQRKSWQAVGMALIGIMSLQINANAQMKIWERDDEIIENYGQIQLRMTKMFNRDAEMNGFTAHTIHRQTSVSAIYRGACRKLINVETVASDTRKLDLSRFLQTRSGNDLPVSDVLEVLRNGILDQCDDEVEVIRFTFHPAHHTKEDYTYEGTMTKANGWRIQDGRVETDFDQYHTFELAYRDVFSVAGMRYRGGCDPEPVLLLEPQFANNQERALAKPVKMHSWGMVAADVSKMYLKECPATETIKFIINPLSQDYKCKTEGQDCFLITRKSDDWKVDASQMVLKEYNSPIADFGDFVEVLAAGRFDIVRHYKNFFGFFLESALGAYSDYCGGHIKDPVGRRIFTVERKFDDNGFLISETVDGEPREIRLERKYADTYDRYFGTWKPWATMRMISSTLKSHHRETNPFLATSLAIGFFTSNINQLQEILSGQCSDERITTAYENMYNFANNKPPITGKFTTDKEPPLPDPDNGSSATEAMKSILAKRQQRVDQQNQRAQAEAQKRMEDFKRRKAEGIRIHSGSKGRQTPAVPSNFPNRNAVNPRAPQNNHYGNANQADMMRQHQENQQKIQALAMEYQKRMLESTQQFSQDMQNAQTPQERLAIQQRYQKEQQQRNLELQQKMMELRGQAN